LKENENMHKDSIFETKDYMYLVSHVNFLILGIIGYLIVYENHLWQEVSNNPNPVAIFVTWLLLGKGFYGIIFFYKYKYKINFYKNKIINKSKEIEINTGDIKEIYIISFFLILDDYFSIRRHHLIGRFFLIIISPIFLMYFIFNTIFKRLYFKKNIIHNFLIIIGKNDKQMIKIQLPLENQEEQEQLENYCKEYLNTDITKLETRFFIPNNEPWFLESKLN